MRKKAEAAAEKVSELVYADREDVSSSMEQMAGTIQKNADLAE